MASLLGVLSCPWCPAEDPGSGEANGDGQEACCLVDTGGGRRRVAGPADPADGWSRRGTEEGIDESAFSEEQEELRSAVRRFLQEKSPSTEVRRLMETTDGFDQAVWDQMANQLGLQALSHP